jgi:two-component system cell cycle response regulator DivK
MNKAVLIVEDDPRNMKLIRDLLQHYGYTTLEAGNGEEGVKLAIEKRPDLILMDIQMPVMDGVEATRIIKANAMTKDIPIVAITSYAMKGDEDRLLQAGCDGYLAKPIDTRKFPEEISAYLSKESRP